jgi:hypothetical protein
MLRLTNAPQVFLLPRNNLDEQKYINSISSSIPDDKADILSVNKNIGRTKQRMMGRQTT